MGQGHRVIQCLECKEKKVHKAHGLCRRCYARNLYREHSKIVRPRGLYTMKKVIVTFSDGETLAISRWIWEKLSWVQQLIEKAHGKVS